MGKDTNLSGYILFENIRDFAKKNLNVSKQQST
jgi:hypothetical protein